MPNETKIITVFNEKGGVGKSTLTLMLAYYLQKNDIPIRVYDFDGQQSTKERRDKDIQFYDQRKKETKEDYKIPYKIELYRPDTRAEVERVLASYRKSLYTSIIDAPGTLSDPLPVPLLSLSDYIICPFQYENSCLWATEHLLRLHEAIEQSIQQPLPSKFIFVPFRVRARVGNASEKLLWSRQDEIFKEKGLLTPSVPDKQCFQRLDTIEVMESDFRYASNALLAIATHIWPDSVFLKLPPYPERSPKVAAVRNVTEKAAKSGASKQNPSLLTSSPELDFTKDFNQPVAAENNDNEGGRGSQRSLEEINKEREEIQRATGEIRL